MTIVETMGYLTGQANTLSRMESDCEGSKWLLRWYIFVMQALHFISAAAPGTTSLINGSTQEWASPNIRHVKAMSEKIIRNQDC